MNKKQVTQDIYVTGEIDLVARLVTLSLSLSLSFSWTPLNDLTSKRSPLTATRNYFLLQWSKVQLAKFSILEHQMDPSSNFSSYRSTLKAAMWRSAGATDERQRIVVPFFSLLVKDLYFLNEGCSNKWVKTSFSLSIPFPLSFVLII